MPVATTSNLLEVIAHMRPGAVYREDGVTWEEYEQLLADLGPKYSVRIFYDEGRMEIMSPAYRHEKPTRVLHELVTVLRDELNVDVESAGSTTFKEELKAKGAEPDDSFYIQHAALIIGKVDLDLAFDPPPDLVIESDYTNSSLDKFPIYVGLGVPEIWRTIGLQVRIWVLVGEHYEKSPTSAAFPFLSAEKLSEFLAKGLEEGERMVAQAFREWVRKHHQPNP
jgi:Uma2 family endonuclease